MNTLSIETARQFLNQHFKLFIEKQKEAGYNCEIILNNGSLDEQAKQHFYIQFCKENECSKCYKIIC
jgi:hypothetical protein